MNIFSRRMVRLIVIVVSIVIVINLSRSIWDLWRRRDILGERQEVLRRVEEENRRLQSELEYAQSPEFIEQEARNRLGLGREGEGRESVTVRSRFVTLRSPFVPGTHPFVTVRFLPCGDAAGVAAVFRVLLGRVVDTTTMAAMLYLLSFLLAVTSPGHVIRGMVEEVVDTMFLAVEVNETSLNEDLGYRA